MIAKAASSAMMESSVEVVPSANVRYLISGLQGSFGAATLMKDLEKGS